MNSLTILPAMVKLTAPVIKGAPGANPATTTRYTLMAVTVPTAIETRMASDWTPPDRAPVAFRPGNMPPRTPMRRAPIETSSGRTSSGRNKCHPEK
jgi:hypothetical protein